MLAKLPNIKGSSHDTEINALIDATNARDADIFRTSASLAIVKFLLESGQSAVGLQWQKSLDPAYLESDINTDLIDRIHSKLVQSTKQSSHRGILFLVFVIVCLATIAVYLLS